MRIMRKQLNKKSKKRRGEEVEYSKLRRKFLEDHSLCQARLHVCTKRSTDVHHKQGRLGSLFLDVTKWLAVCRACHTWIENNPKLAIEKGFSLSRY